MNWEDDLLQALEEDEIILIEDEPIDVTIKIINDPIGVDLDKTRRPVNYIALHYLTDLVKNTMLVKKDYRYLATELQKGVGIECIGNNLQKDEKQSFIDVFFALCKMLPRKTQWVDPKDAIKYLREENPSAKRRMERKMNAEITDPSLQITLLAMVQYLPFPLTEKNNIRKMVEQLDSKSLYAFFRNKNKTKIIDEPQSTQRNNDPFVKSVFTVLTKMF